MNQQDEDIYLPPQNLQAERCVLGSMLLSEHAANFAVESLHPDDFYGPANGITFRAIRDLVKTGAAADAVLVGDRLAARQQLADVGGPIYLHDLLETVPHAEHVRHYAKLVREAAIRRRLIYLCRETVDKSFDPGQDIESLVSQMQNASAMIGSETGIETQSAQQVIARWHDAQHDKPEPITTGLYEIDELIGGGLLPSQLVIVGARPGMGKTSFGMLLAEAAARHDCPSLMVTIEMPDLELIDRVSKQGSDLAEYATLPLFFDGAESLDKICSAVRRCVRLHGIRLVVVDYLQKIATGSRDIKTRVEESSWGLKRLAKDLRISVVALAQLNRGVEDRDNKRPRLRDLKDSGSIEQDADMVLFLHRPEYYDEKDRPGVAELILAKGRNVSTGTTEIGFVKEKTQFVEYRHRPMSQAEMTFGDDDKPF